MDNKSHTPIGFIRARGSSTSSAQLLTVTSATLADAHGVIDTISNAFLHDPTWSLAIPDSAMRIRFWEPFILGALRYPWVFKTSGFETVSVWIPPNGTELAETEEEKIPGLLTELVGPRTADVLELMDRFGAAHPQAEPHYYLSLLGTRDEFRGQGLGMALLKENLARIDAEHMPAYLESSNPVNNERYESVGFVPVSSFHAPGDGPLVTGMWRKSR